MANALAIALHESGEETASGSGEAVDIGATRSACRFQFVVTAVSGTAPSLTLRIQSAPTETGPWTTHHSIGALSAASAPAEVTLAGLRRYVRVIWVIAGTDPAFTFEATGEAHTLYATQADVERFSVPTAALQGVSDSDKANCLIAASDKADGYLNGSYTLPLVSWDSSLRQNVAKVAGYEMMCVRGFRPDGVDDLIIKRHDDAIAWLQLIMAGKVDPPGIVDSEPETFEAGAYVVSETGRGW